jgi:hypothetical protein
MYRSAYIYMIRIALVQATLHIQHIAYHSAHRVCLQATDENTGLSPGLGTGICVLYPCASPECARVYEAYTDAHYSAPAQVCILQL